MPSAWDNPSSTPRDRYPGIPDNSSHPAWAHELWSHLNHEHGLILTESELHEIMLKCDHVNFPARFERAKDISARICCYLGKGLKRDSIVTRWILALVDDSIFYSMMPSSATNAERNKP